MDLELAGIAAAALAAGAINAVAGGGSLVTFPALLAAGYPAKQANMTNSVALVPGLGAVSLGYRRELRGQGSRLIVLALISVAGGAAGAALLLSTPSDIFRRIVPFLIAAACALLAFQGPIAGWSGTRRLGAARRAGIPVVLGALTFVLGVYNGYFGAGYGLMMLPLVAIFLDLDIVTSQGMRSALSVAGNVVAVVLFGVFGPVVWHVAGVVAVGLVCGGYAGTALARAVPPGLLRAAVVVYGLSTAAVLLVRR